jgi:hypothetical protein
MLEYLNTSGNLYGETKLRYDNLRIAGRDCKNAVSSSEISNYSLLKRWRKNRQRLNKHFRSKPVQHFTTSSVNEATADCENAKRRLKHLLSSFKSQNQPSMRHHERSAPRSTQPKTRHRKNLLAVKEKQN